MSYFITGTDTGIGKTLVSCALLHAFAVRGMSVAGFKPVACGCDGDGQNEDVRKLSAASNIHAGYSQINPYNFVPPIAPHIAARDSGASIDFARIMESYRELASQADVVIVEGVGGFLVPLNDGQDSADLAVELGLAVIMVVGVRLGCLNHALLTARAIAGSGLKCAGWVANVLDAEMAALPENIAALQQRIAAPLLGVVPWQPGQEVGEVADQLNLDLL